MKVDDTVKKNIGSMSSDKLAEMLKNPSEYTASALKLAEEELKRREEEIPPSAYTREHLYKVESPSSVVYAKIQNGGFASLLNVIGYVTILIGVVAAIVLFTKSGDPGLFEPKGQISGGELLMVLGAAYYHLVFGMLCIGVSKALRR